MPVIYMDRASAESLTEKDIREIIDENLMDLKYGMLTDYYVGQHRILSETKKDSTAPVSYTHLIEVEGGGELQEAGSDASQNAAQPLLQAAT